MTERTAAPVCYRHSDRPTRLSCTECGRPICVECSHDAAVGQRCPKHAKSEGRHRVVDAHRGTGRVAGFAGAPFVKWTMVVTVGIYIVSRLSDSAVDRGFSDLSNWLYSNLSHSNPAVADGELWRLVSSALLHSPNSIMHILFNMYALYIFGPALEQRVGSLPFAGLYMASAAAGGAFVFLLGEPNVFAVGASGAIFGLFGSWLYVSYRMRGSITGRAQFNQLAVLLGINLALPLFIPNIAWQAHVGGLIGGISIAWAWSRWAVGSDRPELRRTIIAAGVLLISVALVILG
jgi:membrane associated rhomboid family serine protease